MKKGRKRGIWIAAACLIAVLCIGTAGCGIRLIREAVSRGNASDAEVSGDAADVRAETVWPGIYALDGDPAGEIFAVLNSDGRTVTGWYLYETAAGGFGMRFFTWDIADGDAMTATEPFGNGGDEVDTFRLQSDRITVTYPDGWWADRDYLYLCTVEEAGKYVTNPAFDLSVLSGGSEAAAADNEGAVGGNDAPAVTDTTSAPEETVPAVADTAPAAEDRGASQPFYGVWVLGSQELSDCRGMVSRLQSQGFAGAAIFYTTDWSNLNTEPWYVVTAGCYASEDEANAALPAVQAAGYADAYVKYSGERRAFAFE